MSLYMSQNLVRTSPHVLICLGAPEGVYKIHKLSVKIRNKRYLLHRDSNPRPLDLEFIRRVQPYIFQR